MNIEKEEITRENVIKALCDLAQKGKIEILDMLCRSTKFKDQPFTTGRLIDMGNKEISKKECRDQNNFFGFKLD